MTTRRWVTKDRALEIMRAGGYYESYNTGFGRYYSIYTHDKEFVGEMRVSTADAVERALGGLTKLAHEKIRMGRYRRWIKDVTE